MLTILMLDRGARNGGNRSMVAAALSLAADCDANTTIFGNLDPHKDCGPLPKHFTILFPERDRHPEDQMKDARELGEMATKGSSIIVVTHSLTMIYVWNNMTFEGTLAGNVRAFIVEPTPEVPPGYKLINALGDEDFINEQPLGWVSDNLGAEMNKLSCAKQEAKLEKK